MEQRNLKWRGRAEPTRADQLLAARYAQLLQWAKGLARGDKGKAEEIVQEFCLYVTLAKPDFCDVANLDGYLYTSLRHIYLSSLARPHARLNISSVSRLFTAAARAGLRPAPESRSRGACPHRLRSFTTRNSLHLLLLPCCCSTHRAALISLEFLPASCASHLLAL
jgi:DNA-directed RNA polymerase specialized sigma24 family protein